MNQEQPIDTSPYVVSAQTFLDDRAREIAEIEALLEKLSGKHRHRCLQCGTIWEHGSECKGDEDKHRCPHCNKLQWKAVDEGPADPEGSS